MATTATTYRNTDDQVLAVSAVTGAHVLGTSAGQTLTGGAGNDAIRSAGGDTMIGGAGDDTYYVSSTSDVVVEAANGGNDTIISSLTTTVLPDNVENLELSGAANVAFGIGNSLNNLIIAGSGTDTLDGGAGDDVLVGGSGKDTFVVEANAGNKAIYGFKTASDILELQGQTSLTSFANLQQDMAQSGADVVISLPTGQEVVLRNTTLSSLTAANFFLTSPVSTGTSSTGTSNTGTTTSATTSAASSSTTASSTTTAASTTQTATSAAATSSSSQWTLTFDDEFNSLSASATGVGTTWRMDTGTRSGNKEAEDYVATTGAGSPFSVSNGVLSITASTGTNALNLPYNSGELTTLGTFSQTYGLFEVDAKLPAGAGMWPAFWLLNAGGGWPPELDVMEALGASNNGTIYSSTHSATATTQTDPIYVGDTTDQYHVYGVDWEPDTITFYVDGTAVATMATPSDMHSPMYMLLNLAVGGTGSWPGAATGESGTLDVDWVRVYANAADAQYQTTVAKYSTGSGTDQTVHASAASTTTSASTSATTTTTTTAAATTSTAASPAVSASASAAVGASNGVYTAGAAHTAFLVEADDSGNVYLQQGTQTGISLTGITQIAFTDGTALIDPSGAAEAVARIYQAAFDRAPDLAGVQYWAAQITNGTTTAAGVANAFAATSEFTSRYAGLSDSDYVSAVYQDVFGHAPDSGGAAYWTGLLQAGTSRGDVLAGLAGSAENIQMTIGIAGDADESQVYRLYRAAFGAAPDTGGLNYWTAAAQAGSSAAQIAAGFTQTPQFAAEYGAGSSDSDFVAALYQNVLGRAGDSGGTSYWVGALQSGTARSDVLLSFANSSENLIDTSAATHNDWVFIAK